MNNSMEVFILAVNMLFGLSMMLNAIAAIIADDVKARTRYGCGMLFGTAMLAWGISVL